MIYSKPPITFTEQTEKLNSRGLHILNTDEAQLYLSNISYYRLRAYTFPFQDNKDPNHPFIIPVTFEDIIKLYLFDRKLSQIIFSALEKVEIALRTQIIYQWAITKGSHWQLNSDLFRDPIRFNEQISNLNIEINRSQETFIKHYKNKYKTPIEPPSWMSIEVSSFGLLSQLFSNLKKGEEKHAVTNHFGLNDVSILENWMH